MLNQTCGVQGLEHKIMMFWDIQPCRFGNKVLDHPVASIFKAEACDISLIIDIYFPQLIDSYDDERGRLKAYFIHKILGTTLDTNVAYFLCIILGTPKKTKLIRNLTRLMTCTRQCLQSVGYSYDIIK
jgi:hypothetical protein